MIDMATRLRAVYPVKEACDITRSNHSVPFKWLIW